MSEIVFEFSALARLESALLLENDIFQEQFTAAMEDSLELLREPVAVAGERPTSPIHWDSERQRRAFFATNGFGAGIPTTRTNALVESWQKSIQFGLTGFNEMLGRLFTNVPYARYVLDAVNQSNIFRGFWGTVQGKWAEKAPDVNARFGQAVVDGLQEMRDKALG